MSAHTSSQSGGDDAATAAAAAASAEGDSVDEATVVVDREPRRDDDMTVVVERGKHVVDATVAEATVVVERTRPVDGATVVADRNKPASDSTVVVDRGGKSKPPPARGPRGRQRINLPPVEPGFAEQATLAAGPGAVENYTPRQLPAQTSPLAPAQQGAVLARQPAQELASVRSASRRFGIIAVFGFVLACAISAAGLVAIAFGVVRGL